MQHAEALFLVDDHQPDFLEPNVLLDELVRADDDIDRAGGQPVDGGVRLFFGSEPREQFHRDRELGHALAEGVVVLLRQNGGWHEHGHLPPAHHRLERRPDGHLGFAKTNIAANEPIHRARLFHVLLGRLDG